MTRSPKRQPKFILAAQTPLSHNANMTAFNRFTFKIEIDPLSERRFRWTVCEGNQVHIRSPHSYATRREAETEARSRNAPRFGPAPATHDENAQTPPRHKPARQVHRGRGDLRLQGAMAPPCWLP